MRKKSDDELQSERDELLDEIRGLKSELRRVKSVEQEQAERLKAVAKAEELKKEIVELEITHSRQLEQQERKEREVKHLVGLERKRQEFETDAAKREAILSVREENLEADKKRFDAHMQFMEDRFKTEVDYLKGMVTEILERLPTVTVDKAVTSGSRRN